MTQFPAWSAGQKITAAALTSMEAFAAYKAADTPRTSTTTVTADPDLTLSLQPGTYLFDAWILYTGAAVGTGDLKCTFASGSGITVANFSAAGSNTTATSQANWGAPAFGSSLVLGSQATAIAALLRGSLVLTQVNNLAFFWAQNTTSGTATTVKAGSWLMAYQIA